MWLLILIGLAVAAFVVYRFRVPIAAKLLGQPESRIRRQLGGGRRD
jgi:hypothetical protein